MTCWIGEGKADFSTPVDPLSATRRLLWTPSKWTAGLLLPTSPAPQRMAANLVRHIFGTPFRPSQPPPSCPSTVGQLADALYAGEDVAFALADALEEAGHSPLAEHFRER